MSGTNNIAGIAIINYGTKTHVCRVPVGRLLDFYFITIIMVGINNITLQLDLKIINNEFYFIYLKSTVVAECLQLQVAVRTFVA